MARVTSKYRSRTSEVKKKVKRVCPSACKQGTPLLATKLAKSNNTFYNSVGEINRLWWDFKHKISYSEHRRGTRRSNAQELQEKTGNNSRIYVSISVKVQLYCKYCTQQQQKREWLAVVFVAFCSRYSNLFMKNIREQGWCTSLSSCQEP